MPTLESVRLSGAKSFGGSSGGANEYTRALEIEANLQSGHSQGAYERLDTWKEIAAHLRRSVRCVQRWERQEGMPVHRHQHRQGASVYAYRFELDAWWNTGSALADRLLNQR